MSYCDEYFSLPKSQREYIRGIIHNLSLQRWTDQEIADYLNKEKHIPLARTSVTHIRIRMQKQAEKWYFELRESRYKYVAFFKERIDSLLSYQRKLHELTATDLKPEHEIKAITELHAIEVTLFNMWKQLPNLSAGVVNSSTNNDPTSDIYVTNSLYHGNNDNNDDYGYESTQIPPIDEQDERDRFDRWSIDNKPMSKKYILKMVFNYGYRDGLEPPNYRVQCPDCKRWFESERFRANHTCINVAGAAAHSNRWLPLPPTYICCGS